MHINLFVQQMIKTESAAQKREWMVSNMSNHYLNKLVTGVTDLSLKTSDY